ncbi:MAG: spore coat protein [Planctomycetota bacterium]|nr:spore coat protein [Planctomycetota bacterium]
MDIRSPQKFTGGWLEAHQQAKDNLEPVFIPLTPYADDRGWSLMNLLAGAMDHNGQINFSVQYPGAIKAWHRHDLQTDFWTCIQGNLKVGIHRESDGATWLQVMGEKTPGMLLIPPPLWHGATPVGNESAGLLYYMTHLFNAEKPDEHRRDWDSIEGFPWGIRHG